MRSLIVLAMAIVPLAASPLRGAPSETPLPVAELAPLLRDLLLANIPSPLIQKSFDWGATREVPVGVKWKRRGVLLKPEIMLKEHNDGLWRKISVTADAPDKTLRLGVEDVRVPEDGRMTFILCIALPVHIHFEQQVWKSGVRLYSGSTRARCRVGVRLRVESVCRLEKNPNSFIPDLVCRMRATEATLAYDDVVIEHTLGVGGDAAKILGDTFLDCVKQWKPSIERELLAKGNAGIVKAADTKEVRLSLAKLLEGKSPLERKK